MEISTSRIEKSDVPSIYNVLQKARDIEDRNFIYSMISYLQSENILSESFIVRNEEECLGFVVVESGYKSKEILYLYIVEKYRNIGLGSELLNKVKEDAIRSQKCIKLFFHQTLSDFYSKNGFETSKEISCGIWDYTQKKEN